MKFERLLSIVGGHPLFETGLLLAGDVDSNDVRRQLARWVRTGRVIQLRRGLYTLAPPYRKGAPHPFVVANALVTGSYVSVQTALAFYGLIPEYVSLTISITPRRPAEWHTPLGDFRFHHLASRLFFGYRQIDFPEGQTAFVATPEKALLDLVHLTPGGDTLAYLRELRLQNLERLNHARLREFARRSAKPKWRRATEQIIRLAEEEQVGYQPLAA